MSICRNTGAFIMEGGNMARDDYYVIVHQILSYLYRSLKEGTEVDPKMLIFDGYLFKINERYWLFIIQNMVNDGYMSGVQVVKAWGDYSSSKNFRNL